MLQRRLDFCRHLPTGRSHYQRANLPSITKTVPILTLCTPSGTQATSTARSLCILSFPIPPIGNDNKAKVIGV
ncbi:MAG: hypothetical protein RIE73_08605 [Coleofasciculus sp. C1-SOL-03]